MKIHRTITMTLSSLVLLTIGLIAGISSAAAQSGSSGTTITATAATNGNVLPSNTLIVLQRKQPIGLLSGGIPVSVAPEQYGIQSSRDGSVGVRLVTTNGLTNLVLVNNRTGETKPIPQATGLSSPNISWKRDGSGLAYSDFPLPGKNSPTGGAILYYNVSANSTSVLIKAPGANQLAQTVAWSPDGRYLIYLTTNPNSATPTQQPFLLDTSNNTNTALPLDTSGFLFWDGTSTGFFVMRGSIATTTSQLVYYLLNTLTAPTVLTPANTLDLQADLAPDGKHVVVLSGASGQKAAVFNLYIMNINGSNRKALTQFKASDQTITGLAWGTDGIYYSLSGTNDGTTWKVNLDGTNPQQVAQGTLIEISGLH